MTQPHSIEAEKIVLGTILLEPGVLPIAIQELRPEMFYHHHHELIFKVMVEMFGKGKKIDLLTLVESVKPLNADITPYYLTTLTNNVVSSVHFDAHIEIVKDKYLKRELIKVSIKTASEASNETALAIELIATHNGQVYNLSHQTQRDQSIGELLNKVYFERKERKQGLRGYPTGYLCLDSVLNGLMDTDLTIIAGRPGQGKTAFAVNLLVNLAVKKKIPSAYFSLEMGADQIIERLESCYTGIAHEKLSMNQLDQKEDQKLILAHDEISESPLFITDPARIDINQLRAKISLFKARNDLKVCFIDYLQLVAGTGRKDGYETITEVSKGLKAIAREFKVSMVCLAQLSREVEKRPDKMPQLSDLKESGQIEQDADRVIFLMRPEYYGIPEIQVNGGVESSKGKIIVKTAKNRHGALGQVNVLNWKPEVMRVVEFEETPF